MVATILTLGNFSTAASIMPKMVWGRTSAETYYRYIDAPNFAYDFWLEGVDSAGRIGSPPGGPALHVGIVGGGVAGLCAAYELARAGWTVTVLEASDAPHGRTSLGQRPTRQPHRRTPDGSAKEKP